LVSLLLDLPAQRLPVGDASDSLLECGVDWPVCYQFKLKLVSNLLCTVPFLMIQICCRELVYGLLGMTVSKFNIAAAYRVFELNDVDGICTFKRRSLSVVKNDIGDFNGFRCSRRLISRVKPFNGNSD
jgi:hypothetical protein